MHLVQLLLEDAEVCDFDEYVSIGIAVLGVLRELHGVDPATEKYRDGQRIIAGLVARTLRKGNQNGTRN